MLTFSFVKGDQVLGEIECSSDEISSGESSELDCLGDKIKPGSYDTIRVADFF